MYRITVLTKGGFIHQVGHLRAINAAEAEDEFLSYWLTGPLPPGYTIRVVRVF